MNSIHSTNKGYILLVEDDPGVQAANVRILNRKKHASKQAYTLAEAQKYIAEEIPRAIVLDVLMPDGNGFEFLRELRKTSTVPVLLLTSLDTGDDILEGLKAGGDNYITKPYNQTVFLSQLEALLRRSETTPEVLTLGAIRLEVMAGRMFIGDDEIPLTQKETSLMQIFMPNHGQVFASEYLYEKVWGCAVTDETQLASMKNILSKLRQKLSSSEYTISYEHREGYMLDLA